MKQNEKQLIILAGALFVLVLIVRIVPLLTDWYQSGQEEIARLEDRIARFQTLIAETDEWMEREALKRAEVADLETWIFAGDNPNLVGSSVQRTLRQAVDKSGISIRSMDVARFAYVDGWLQVNQDMDFILDQDDILPFLAALDELRPRLHVTAFDITRNRRQYTGSITVTGFSHAN
jgi:hypothetical protein